MAKSQRRGFNCHHDNHECHVPRCLLYHILDITLLFLNCMHYWHAVVKLVVSAKALPATSLAQGEIWE